MWALPTSRWPASTPRPFAANLPLFFATYILGSLAFNGVCVLLMKPAKALAVKSVQRTQSETA